MGVVVRVAAFLLATTLVVAPVAAQQATGVLGSPSATNSVVALLLVWTIVRRAMDRRGG